MDLKKGIEGVQACRETTRDAQWTHVRARAGQGLQTRPGAAQASFSADRPPYAPLGIASLDAALGGGLMRGTLHEVFAAAGPDLAAATGFGLGLAHQIAQGRPLLWIRQDFLDHEAGRIHPPGLSELGLPLRDMVYVRVRDGLGALRAGAEGLRCAALGAVLIDLWGEQPMLDLTASRRLSLTARSSQVTAFVLRTSATPLPSSAQTRWQVRAHPSRALAAGAPGFPTFSARLMRQRSGPADREWIMEWNRDSQCLIEPDASASLSGAGLSLPRHRTLAPPAGHLRRRAG